MKKLKYVLAWMFKYRFNCRHHVLCPVCVCEVVECPMYCKIGDRHCAACKSHQQLVCNGMFLNHAKNCSDKNAIKVVKLKS